MTLNQLKGKQSALKGRITNIENQLTVLAVAPSNLQRYQDIKRKLTEYLDKCESLNEEIYAVADAAEQATQQIESDAIDAKIRDLIDKLAAIPDPAAATGIPPGGPDVGIRLPKMEIPTFSGHMQDWSSFYDLFVATIHNNVKLSKAHKLQYLKSSLKGNAATLIQSLQITDANYDEAWSLLSARYDNKREIVHAHLKRLFAQSALKDESATGLRALIDTTNECIRALKVLNRPVDQWDDMLVFLVTERLDSEARRQWILSLANDNPPTYADLMKFLDQRARALAEAGESSKQKSSWVAKAGGDRKPTMAVHHGAIQGNCVSCSGSHQLYRCPDFLTMSVPERKALVKKCQLCFNCFRGQHNASKCTSGACRKCGSQHNTLLHSEGKPETDSHSEVASSSNVKSNLAIDRAECTAVLLSTAIIKVADSTGKLHSCRALLDNGSEASFVSEELVHRLGLKRQHTNTFITGVN